MEFFSELDINELNELKAGLTIKYNQYKDQGLKLDMSRGKPSPEQLDISKELMATMEDFLASDGTDTRNYGGVDGLPEAKALFAQLFEVSPDEVIVGGNSSLNMMYDTVARAFSFGVFGSKTPWCKVAGVKFLCPSPGYDRHFSICELFGIEMIAVDMKNDGPDMDQVERLAAGDESVKGIWCVPKYSNPDGITYSDQVVDRLAAMKTAAGDFRIFWDNAYAVHHLSDNPDKLKNIFAACREAGNADRVFMYTSTSKITFASAGVAAMAASGNNTGLIKKQMSVQTIGPDKVNQLRHTRYFRTVEDINTHMKKHAAVIKPKFDVVLTLLEKELGNKNIALWNKPNGGYFISLNTMDGCAGKVVRMAAEAGVVLTKAGATFPYGKDPRDRNIRIAPTYPSLQDLEKAIEILCVCVQFASVEKILEGKK